MLPVLSEQLGQNEIKQSMKVMSFAIKMNALLVLPLVLLVSIASPYIMNLYGAGFRSGWPTLVVVLLTAGILTVQTPITQVIVASGKMWISFAINIGWALIFIVSTILLLDLGSLGLATARAVSYAIQNVWIFAIAVWIVRKAGKE